MVMIQPFSVKCGRCGTLLETEVAWPGKGTEIDKMSRLKKIVCPRCHFVTSYDPKGFS